MAEAPRRLDEELTGALWEYRKETSMDVLCAAAAAAAGRSKPLAVLRRLAGVLE